VPHLAGSSSSSSIHLIPAFGVCTRRAANVRPLARLASCRPPAVCKALATAGAAGSLAVLADQRFTLATDAAGSCAGRLLGRKGAARASSAAAET
jgi:hypothetical protein